MKSSLRSQLRNTQKIKFLYFAGAIAAGIATIATAIYMSLPNKSVAGNSFYYPSFSFHNPVLISGTAGSVNAVYKFSNVGTGIDAHIKIISFYNGATLNNMDHFTAGYYDAWQPFVNSPGNKSSWINWRITFKKAGTNTDTVLTRLAATAIDVDGDGSALKEIIGAHPVSTYSVLAGAQVTVTFGRDSCMAISSFSNVANIDTNITQAMFMKIFNNVSTINYRTGAASYSSGIQVRQNSIYFRYFDMMPSPLPIELASWKAEILNSRHVRLVWSTSSEKNNDFFIIERSPDGENFEEAGRVKGAGNSNDMKYYSYIDKEPFSGVSYYRLKQTDYDGTTASFKPVAVDLSRLALAASTAQIAPNPFTNYFKLNFSSDLDQNGEMILTNMNGQVLYSQKIELQTGRNELSYANAERLQPGIYFVKVFSGKKLLVSQKVVKE